jgi:broad specificity phosphatase PhoE
MTGQHTGSTDIGLTAHGEDEVRALAAPLRTTHFSKILTSPLRRARQTCELAGCGPAEVDPDLEEWNYGDYEGLLPFFRTANFAQPLRRDGLD